MIIRKTNASSRLCVDGCAVLGQMMKLCIV